jgi:hypothetical protein
MKRPASLKRTGAPGDRARSNGVGVPKLRRRAISTCTPAQRLKVRETGCIISGDRESVTPAHVIPRGVTTVGQNDLLAVVGLRGDLHRLYDDGELDLLPWLERACKPELAFAVMRVGLMSTLRRVTNHRWSPDGDMRGERY